MKHKGVAVFLAVMILALLLVLIALTTPGVRW